MFRWVMTVLFVAVLAWAVAQAWWGDPHGAIALMFIAGFIYWIGGLRKRV